MTRLEGTLILAVAGMACSLKKVPVAMPVPSPQQEIIDEVKAFR